MKMFSTVPPLMLALTSLALAGCMSVPNSSPDFGDSVANMTSRQVYDPAAASVPPLESMEPVDGELVERAVVGYRESGQREGETIQNDILINVGN